MRETNQDSVAVVAKRQGASDATIYIWRKNFGQLDTDEVKRLKPPEAEDAQLKKLPVDWDLENVDMKEITEKIVSLQARLEQACGDAWIEPAANVCADVGSSLRA